MRFPRAATNIVEALIGPVSFDGPLTETPAPDAPSVERVLPDPAVVPPAAGPVAGPKLIVVECGPDSQYGILPGHARLMAWDCLFGDDPGHVCRNHLGDPIRGGQSCYHSASLMSRRDFANHPLYAKAVGLGLVT